MASALKIALNGVELETVAADGLNVIDVRVRGDRRSLTFASLHVDGGMYGVDEAEQTHFVWECERELRPGTLCPVSFLRDGATSVRRKTLDEVWPEYQEPYGPPRPVNEVLHELTANPIVRGDYHLVLSAPTGGEQCFQTESADDTFGFTVIGNWVHPERARAWLTSNSLQRTLNREDGTWHVTFDLKFRDEVVIRIESEPRDE